MKMYEYNVILENGEYALIERGTKCPEYAVVYGLVPECERKYEGSDWSWTVSYACHNAEGLFSMLDLFRKRTEDNYLSKVRLIELATKFKDRIAEDAIDFALSDEEFLEFFTDECDMTEEELDFFEIKRECE